MLCEPKKFHVPKVSLESCNQKVEFFEASIERMKESDQNMREDMEKRDLNMRDIMKDMGESFISVMTRINEINEKHLNLLINQMERQEKQEKSLAECSHQNSELISVAEKLLQENARLKREEKLGAQLMNLVNQRQQELGIKCGQVASIESSTGFTNHSIIKNQFPHIN